MVWCKILTTQRITLTKIATIMVVARSLFTIGEKTTTQQIDNKNGILNLE